MVKRTEDTVAAFRKELGLDKPSYVRYFDWIGRCARRSGTSFSGRAASGQDRSESRRLDCPKIAKYPISCWYNCFGLVPLA